ncbi:MAG: B12-binding domain-containing radical SAM protein [Akkermansiaceae bacterium]|nr:B12-binding domain-containing radical SAM protein [Akkermansiaceae bacterium]
MSEILLATLNSRYIHTAFGLRCLHANLGDLRGRAAIREFDIKQRPVDIAEALLAGTPRIIGLGIYIWNIEPATALVELLKQVSPATLIVLGGPEVSYPTDLPAIAALADHVITGEADLAFAGLCRDLLAGITRPQLITAPLPAPGELAFPYDTYTDEDLAHRVLYVEASRGCPFACEFCLSSVNQPVRDFPLDGFLAEMERLIARGARTFKFLDRTFNLDLRTGTAILRFFHEHWQPGMFLHFEMIPDRFPEGLREWIVRFPPGALQFEVGIQTFNPEVTARINRRQNIAKLEDNLGFLKHHTGVHVHADLILGLPGENLASIAAGFDRLWQLGPQEIQVGILKRLRGTPIIRHDREFAMVYSPRAPYELLSNRDLDFPTMQRLKRFARYWDMVANSGRFRLTLPVLLEHPRQGSAFHNFMAFSDLLHTHHGRQHGISPENLGARLLQILTTWGVPTSPLRESLRADHQAAGTRNPPAYLSAKAAPATASKASLNRRQQRHAD